MDPVADIKARLPIEELVGRYCQLQKKGRNFVCLCPFHQDTHPSLLVSPDKGIAWCFACQSGGDVFGFYQRIEGVDFVQALKDLAERTGVALPERGTAGAVIAKDEKEKLRACLEAAETFYQEELKKNPDVIAYLSKRGVGAKEAEEFGLGLAPDSFSATYDHLLKAGCARSEIVLCGLGVQKDLQGKIYDRFRNRLMFPIHDGAGRLIGFGGRALGDDDAKYLNTSEGPLYHKSAVLYGLHRAKEAMRQTEQAIVVEGYFDVLACHRAGFRNVVAVSGTALTEQHAALLRRHCESVVLCLDQDRAGREAAERAFGLCSRAGLLVRAVVIGEKDPADLAVSDMEALRTALQSGGEPYLDLVLRELSAEDLSDIARKRAALHRLLPLIQAIQTSTERDHYLVRAAAVLGTTDQSLREDLDRLSVAPPTPVETPTLPPNPSSAPFSKAETTLGLFLLFPNLRPLLDELIEPPTGFAASLYRSLKEGKPLPAEEQERAAVLQLFWEHHEAAQWSEQLATREIRKNCANANRDLINQQIYATGNQMRQAEKDGKMTEKERLKTQSGQLIQLKGRSGA